jgi:hypothetical protein
VPDLIARCYLLIDGKDYWPGDILPSEDADRASELVENGAARWVEPTAPLSTASLTTALPGLSGSAVGGGGEEDNLVGKVPRRRRK